MNVVTQFSASPEYNPDPRFRAMFEGAAMGLGICRLDGRIVEANPALSKMLGYNEEELTGRRAGDFIGKVRAERRGEIGREIYPGSFAPDEQALGQLLRGERNSFETEKRYRRKDGSEVWGHLTVSLGRNSRREPAFLIAVLADASVHRRMAEHLCEVEKMEIIGRLAGGIAHDFNNLLTGILLYCDLMTTGLEKSEEERRRLDNGGFENKRFENHGFENHHFENRGWDPGELWQHVEEVRKAGEQGAALTKQLLAIARKQAVEPHLVAINEIVTSSEDLLRRLIGKQIELVVALDSGAGLVMADPAQLRQVLLNLALNARDAVAQGGKIRLITRATEFPGAAKPGGLRRAVSLAVEDSGCGMDVETRARLFEPFFTTKGPGVGTGLGLATVARIVSEASGAIKVESEPGRGTCIEVFFPAIESSAHRTSSLASTPALFAHQASLREGLSFTGELLREIGSKTVLLVDDHPAARKSIERILLVAGYRVLTAPDGKHALQLFTEHATAVDLLIAECMMPEMNGQELAETLRQQKPGLKVLLVSGFLDVPIDPAVTTVNVIRKPFSGKTLIERVVEVMLSP